MHDKAYFIANITTELSMYLGCDIVIIATNQGKINAVSGSGPEVTTHNGLEDALKAALRHLRDPFTESYGLYDDNPGKEQPEPPFDFDPRRN